ncbi:MAG: hypothetical protein JNK67_00215 [Alphaproteobacteria bacterium]|nr:hypothetical protein [Alphaproteobacteria bacterium]
MPLPELPPLEPLLPEPPLPELLPLEPLLPELPLPELLPPEPLPLGAPLAPAPPDDPGPPLEPLSLPPPPRPESDPEFSTPRSRAASLAGPPAGARSGAAARAASAAAARRRAETWATRTSREPASLVDAATDSVAAAGHGRAIHASVAVRAIKAMEKSRAFIASRCPVLLRDDRPIAAEPPRQSNLHATNAAYDECHRSAAKSSVTVVPWPSVLAMPSVPS